MEILAPINTDTLEAALEAGADAVYFGLKRLNARRGARNYGPAELKGAVERIHAAGAKAHLTVNIDLDSRETGLAARTLQLAAECGVDAVIVRDPAILSWRRFFPTLEFHLSTQAGVSSSAGVRAAAALGCDRVVLARELTRAEIQACCEVGGIAIEAFAQGAMCFCCSGRCLLSSWVGGRSGNRGACASPCRVAWRGEAAGAQEAHPLSMHDLSLVGRLPELAAMGVSSLKIEGRLKAADWVRRAVALYRHASAPGADLAALREEAVELGRYTGRAMGEGYYNGDFDGLTDADAGRSAGRPSSAPRTPASAHLALEVREDERQATCVELRYGDSQETLRLPPQRIANPRRAARLDEMLAELLRQLPPAAATTLDLPQDLAGKLLPRRCAAQLQAGVEEFLRRCQREDDGTVRIALPPEVAAASAALPPGLRGGHPENRRHLGDLPNRVRCLPGQLAALAKRFPGQVRFVLEADAALTPADAERALASLAPERRGGTLLALPQVAYEASLPALSRLCAWAASCGIAVEVNSWDGWWLAREAGAAWEGGPGLAVLNPVAARFLASLGARCCHVSPEIDQGQLEELSANATTPLALTVFSYPALMTTRARLPQEFADGTPFADGRGTRLRAEASADGALTRLVSCVPFDWRRVCNPRVAAAWLEADFTGSADLAADGAPAEHPFLFNYDRQLR